MEYINLGKTGLKVSRICLGLHELRRARARGAPLVARRGKEPAVHQAGPRARASTSSTPPTSTPTARAKRSSAGRSRDFAKRDEVVIATKVYYADAARPQRQRACRARRS